MKQMNKNGRQTDSEPLIIAAVPKEQLPSGVNIQRVFGECLRIGLAWHMIEGVFCSFSITAVIDCRSVSF